MPWWYFAHAQDDVSPHILRVLEDTFSLDAAHYKQNVTNDIKKNIPETAYY